MKSFERIVYGVVLSGLLAACAGTRFHREGMQQLAEGKTEEGLLNLALAVKENPDNIEFRTDLLARRNEQISRLLVQADTERSAGKLDNAGQLLERVRKIEPANARAAAGLAGIEQEQRHQPLLEQAKEAFKKGEAEHMLQLLKPVLIENPAHAGALALKRQMEEAQAKELMAEPSLKGGSKKSINLEFREANLRIVFDALSRSSGINFILDRDVRADLRTTVFLRHASLDDAMDMILQTNRLEKKVLNRSTILIYPSTPEKLKEYQELVVKGFYLANADVRQTQLMLKGMLKTKDIFIDEKINWLVMRDTPDAIKLAEKLIAMQDLNEPEVMLEVEVLEVKRSRLLELGIQWPNQLTMTPISRTGKLSLSELKHVNADQLGVSVPSATINLRRDIGDANILANPRIRARNREKAKIMIGDRVPVSTSTTTATGVISESVQYLDVGIKLDVEPNVYLQDEVAIKVALEVSSIVNQVRTPGGSLAYQIGSRSVSTVLRLKDGETQVLAGLISDEDRTGASRVPGLGDIPMLGRLFSSQKDERQKTEIVLSITPHLVRNLSRPDAAQNEFWSGTESTLRSPTLALPAAGRNEGNGPNGAGKTDAASPAGDAGAVNAPTMIALNWAAPAKVKVGEQFKVVLKMKSDGGVRSLPIQLGFDAAAVKVVDVAEGPFFKHNDAKTNMSSNIDLTMGKVFASVVRAGADGAKGEDNVIVLTLVALAAKQAAEIKVLSATPIAVGDKTVMPILPAPLLIDIVN